jgi:acrylyl-CoA reductase (NADPH)/3-hydroxypropionyl-CoA dehydratase/3-hydroxypropionyl-CoA synthetase
MQARDASLATPGAFHGAIAKRELHWFDASLGSAGAWITWDDAVDAWTGWDVTTLTPLRAPYGAAHEPWHTAFDDGAAPFYRWFDGGRTNAAFNEIDRHVLAGHGAEVAFHFEGDRWDQSLDDGRGGPVVRERITRRQLLLESARAAIALRGLGLVAGDRVAINMPNIPAQVFWQEGAKRLGIVFTPVFGGFSDKTLSDRIHDAGARVVITADGGYRNAQVVPFKEAYTDPALDDFLAVGVAVGQLRMALESLSIRADVVERIAEATHALLADEITVTRSDVMRALGRALESLPAADAPSPAVISQVRIAAASALVASPARVETVVVVRHTGQGDLRWREERDRWSHELLGEATRELQAAAARLGLSEDLDALDDASLARAIWSVVPPAPLDAEFPLFFIYTSGSTGKPKGVVHVHGGWLAGVAYTMRVAFDAHVGDVIYVVADPGWITGQSYMIAAALCCRITSILAEGAPLFPSAGRFASIIERYRVTIFKAGATFLKSVMTDPQNAEDVRRYATDSLKVATFCAEPVSPAVQEFAMSLLTPWYINSYWATEHGGIVWTHFYGNADFPLRPDAHTYPLPWVHGDVWVAEGEPQPGGVAYRPAEDGEKGEIVIAQPYPYLCRTIWGDTARFVVRDGAVDRTWQGDLPRFSATYWRRWAGTLAYTQGDFAIRHADGSFSLHGRSDDVINVSGHRLGTEEIEGAILRDKQLRADSPVGNVIVVGAPHREKGLTPLAFVTVVPGRTFSGDDRKRLAELVRQEKGVVAVPADFIVVPSFPETRSGKYVRRMVRALVEGGDLGDASTLRNPESLDGLRTAIATWQERQSVEESQRLFEATRYFRVRYTPIPDGRLVALVTVTSPPVNALNERALDELVTLVEHLTRRTDVAGIIFTGDGPNTFVAGADIRQLLEEVRTLDEALPLPNNAHLAFRMIEASPVPCIAAINGTALGGGMEFALACHYRIAEPTAVLGQPEIRLNLLPGYGGTQRLPRLLAERDGAAGLLRALEVIAGGRTITAGEALRDGIVDVVTEGGAGAVAAASALLRDFAMGQGTLVARFAERQAARKRWEEPGDVDLGAVFAHPEVARLRAQAERVGRSAAIERVFEAVTTGWTQGIAAGLRREADLFAQAVVDPAAGKAGIQAFVDRRSAPLPIRRDALPPADSWQRLEASGELLPLGAPFWPGFTAIPQWQYGHAVLRDAETGAPEHGLPKDVERLAVVPVTAPGPNDALVYMLASEVNFNDIWAITGIPVSPFDNHDLDYQVTGSGGVGLVAALGSEVRREGRLAIGDLVTVYSGTSELLSPMAGRDPMYAGFAIQGYETDTGSHQQFLRVQAPQLHTVPPDLTLEAAGSYVLNLGTIVRALFTTLAVQTGRTLFVEGAATGTGHEALKAAVRAGLRVTGLVSSAERVAAVARQGAAAINRRDPALADLWTIVPSDRAGIAAWEAAGAPLVEQLRAANGGRGADYVVSHAGETAFPRSFQLLEEGGTLTFYGASSGYYFTFVGKPGARPADAMLAEARLGGGESVLVYYGVGDRDALLDAGGLEAIEAARGAGARIVVATRTDAQREFVQSLGFGDRVRGVVSIEELERREGDDFEWPDALPVFPDPKRETPAFKDAVRAFQERTIKPFGSAVGRLLRAADNPRGAPDLIIERAAHDALGVSTSLVKPFTGRVVYFEEMRGRRYTFYAPQVWMRQRRIIMPGATIAGTHLCNAYEVTRMNEMIAAGALDVTPPTLVPWEDLPEAHQAMWDNRHAGANYVVNHALPAANIRTRDELFERWAATLRGDPHHG